MTLRLRQTRNENWDITLHSPQHAGWEVKIAEFKLETALMEKTRQAMINAAALSFLSFIRDMGENWEVTSPCAEAKAEMEALLHKRSEEFLLVALRAERKEEASGQ